MKSLINLGILAPYVRKDTAKECHFLPGKLNGTYSSIMVSRVVFPDGTVQNLTQTSQQNSNG